MDETGCRRWIGFGVFALVVVGGTALAIGFVAMNFLFESCGGC